jgi:uncharacterized protein (TIGR02246 family)
MTKRNSTPLRTQADLAEAKDLDRRFTEAMSRKDVDAAMACFWDDPNLVVVLDGHVQQGPDAVRAGIEEIFHRAESIRMQVRDITYLQSGDGVVGVGTATMDLQSPGGSRKLTVERWSDLRRKIDGRWVYVLDHITNLPE